MNIYNFYLMNIWKVTHLKKTNINMTWDSKLLHGSTWLQQWRGGKLSEPKPAVCHCSIHGREWGRSVCGERGCAGAVKKLSDSSRPRLAPFPLLILFGTLVHLSPLAGWCLSLRFRLTGHGESHGAAQKNGPAADNWLYRGTPDSHIHIASTSTYQVSVAAEVAGIQYRKPRVVWRGGPSALEI